MQMALGMVASYPQNQVSGSDDRCHRHLASIMTCIEAPFGGTSERVFFGNDIGMPQTMDATTNRGGRTMEILIYLVIFVAWIILQVWVLPRFGVKT